MIAVLSIGTWCSSKRQGDINCREFEFKNLNKDTNKWAEEAAFEHVSNSFFKEHIYPIKELKQEDPKSLYRVCDLMTDKLNGFVVAELNGSNWYMYFIPKSGDGMFMLACVEVSADDYLMKKSKLISDGNLEMTKIYISNEENSIIKDSVATLYFIEKNQFVKNKSDSIRSVK
jgi:hypothetical protein